MLHSMPGHIAAEWQAFLSLEPTGTLAEDLRSAQICTVLAAIHAGKGKTYSLKDFIPNAYQPPPKPQTAEEMFALLEGMFPNEQKH